MRVLYVIDSLSPSGAERSLVETAPSLLERSMSLIVAYLYERPGLRDQLHAVGARTLWVGDPRGLGSATVRLRRSIRRLRPDIVHTTLFDADVAGRTAAWFARAPSVSSLVNVHYGPEQLVQPGLSPAKVRAAQVLDAATARMSVGFHAISEHVADTMAERLRIRRELIDVIPRGRDPRLLGERAIGRRTTARRTLGIDDETPIVLAVARHEHQKGLDVLLEAFPAVMAAFPDAVLMIAGREGGASPRLYELGARHRLGGRVRFLGPRDDVPELLCAADVFAFPSRWEGLGGSLLEAMALQCPIVASDIPPVREVVADDVTALLAAPGDAMSFAECLIAALKDRDRSEAMAAAARERFLGAFTIDHVADRMVRFYERALIA